MPKRILFIDPVGEKGGAEVVLTDMTRCLDQTQYQPVVACLKPGPLVEELTSYGISTFALQAHKTRELPKVAEAVRQLRRIIRRERIDLLHCNGCTMLFYGALAGLQQNCPCIWHVYDPLKGSGLFERAFVAAQRRMRPAWTIFGTPAVEDSYLPIYRNIRRYSTILPGVDVSELHAGADPCRARQKLGIPVGAPIISMFARLQRMKGHHYLIEAAKDILIYHPETRFVICGGTLFGLEADYPRQLRVEIDRNGLTERFIQTGYVSDTDKKDILAASSIVAHPALSEPFGIAVIEGMAMGKPVVVTDCAGPTITVEQGKSGMIVPRGDSAALSKALIELLDDPQRSAEMGRQGQNRVIENYSVHAMVRQVETVYDTVLGEAVA